MIYREYIRYLKSIKINPKKSRVSRDHISFEGSNSILIVGGSNVAWPKEVSGFAQAQELVGGFFIWSTVTGYCLLNISVPEW